MTDYVLPPDDFDYAANLYHEEFRRFATNRHRRLRVMAFDAAAFEEYRRRPYVLAMAERILADWDADDCMRCDDCGDTLELDGRCLYCRPPRLG